MDIRKLCDDPDFLERLEVIGWTRGHILRKEENSIVNRISKNAPESKRLTGRPERIWLD